MNAYKLITDEEDVIAANTVIQALIFYCNETGVELNDFSEDDDIEEIPESEWETFMISNIDGDLGDKDKYSLKELMEGEVEPQLICTTAY